VNKDFETKFDKVFFFTFLILIAMSFFMTSIFKHALLYFVPILFLLAKLVFRKSFLRQVFYSHNPVLSIMVWQIFLIPSLVTLLQANYQLFKDHNLQWLSYDNSWVILFCYALANYFLLTNTGLKLKMDKAFYALNALLFGFLIDFFYSVLKWFNSGFAVENRWQGSSGNPQLWAIQLSIVLLVWVLINKDLDTYFSNRFLSRVIFVCIILGIVLTGSISNFVGLFFAALSFLIPSSIIVLISAIAYVFAMNFFVINYLKTANIDIISLKESLSGVAHKFLPRIRLWLKLLRELPNYSFNTFLGMGLETYNNFIESATNAKHQNAHSIYAHNYLINGFLGIYMHLIVLFNALKDILKNKYLLAISVFIMTSSVFDCALTYLEVQLVFWLTLPLVLPRIIKSS
jgi:hypothetical protein